MRDCSYARQSVVCLTRSISEGFVGQVFNLSFTYFCSDRFSTVILPRASQVRLLPYTEGVAQHNVAHVPLTSFDPGEIAAPSSIDRCFTEN